MLATLRTLAVSQYIKHPFNCAFMPKKRKLKFFWVPDELGSQIVLRICSEYQFFGIFRPFRLSRFLARDMSNQATPISAKYCLKIAQMGVTRSPISRARDLETRNGQKIPKNWYSEQILRTIWLPSSSGTRKNLSLLFLAKKAHFSLHKSPLKRAQLRPVPDET